MITWNSGDRERAKLEAGSVHADLKHTRRPRLTGNRMMPICHSDRVTKQEAKFMWAHIHGVLTVWPEGRTITEQEYVLKTVLEHQPMIWQDGGIMETIVSQSAYPNAWAGGDRFENESNLIYTKQNQDPDGAFEFNTEFFVILDAHIRHDSFDETYRRLVRWLCRFARRIWIDEILVHVYEYGRSTLINYNGWSENHPLKDMWDRTWVRERLFNRKGSI